MLEQNPYNGLGATLACQIQRYVVGVRYGIQPGRLFDQPFHNLEVGVDDGMNEWRVVVVVDKVNGPRGN